MMYLGKVCYSGMYGKYSHLRTSDLNPTSTSGEVRLAQLFSHKMLEGRWSVALPARFGYFVLKGYIAGKSRTAF